jgi:hypothetical protein
MFPADRSGEGQGEARCQRVAIFSPMEIGPVMTCDDAPHFNGSRYWRHWTRRPQSVPKAS